MTPFREKMHVMNRCATSRLMQYIYIHIYIQTVYIYISPILTYAIYIIFTLLLLYYNIL